MRINLKSIFTLTVTLTLILYADIVKSQITIDAQIRPRGEYRYGYRVLPPDGMKAAAFISQRTRLNFLYESEKVDAYISLQDVRVWGNDLPINSTATVGVYQAWASVHLSKQLRLKLGRQEIYFDDERIFGKLNWAQNGRSHDAAVLIYNKNNWTINMGGAYNNEKESVFVETYLKNTYKTLWLVHINKHIEKKLNATFLLTSDGNITHDSTQIIYRYTGGFSVDLIFNKLKFKANLHGQTGQDSGYRDISAFMATLSVTAGFSKGSVQVGYDFLSGTNSVNNEKGQNNSFNTLFGTNHPYYGYMDYFLNIPNDTKQGGLQDLHLIFKHKLHSKFELYFAAHYFLLANNVADPDNPALAIDKYLGTELDAAFTYNITKEIVLKGGYSILAPTSSMEVIKGGNKNNFPNWGWLMINIHPQIFTNAKN